MTKKKKYIKSKQDKKKEQLNTFYRNAKECTLEIFKKAVSGDLKALIKKGNPKEEELTEALSCIIEEYNSLIGETSQKLYFGKYKQLAKMEGKLSVLNNLIHLCYLDKSNIKALKELLGIQNIEKAIARYKRFEIEYLSLKKEIENMNTSKNGETDSYKYYTELQISVSDNMGIMIPDYITVYDFALMVKRFNEKIEQLKKK